MNQKPSYTFIFYLLVFIWLGFVASILVPSFFTMGLYPREAWGLLGIFTSPFIHASWQHLTANSVGILIFGTIFSWVVKGATKQIIFYIIVVQGILTWLFAREGNHIGASGLVFGLFGYLISLGFFERRLKYIFVSALVMILWGGTIFGVLPTSSYVSWEAHLLGFLAGVSAAKFGLD